MIKSSANGIQSDSPSNIKEFNAISLESNVFWDVSMATSNDQTQVIDFKDYEGIKYASIPRSRKSSSGNNSQYFVLGRITPAQFLAQLEGSNGERFTIRFSSEIKHFVPIGNTSQVKFYSEQPGAGNRIVPLFPASSAELSEINGNIVTISKTGTGQPLVSENLDPVFFLNPEEEVTIMIEGQSIVYGDQLRDAYTTVLCVTDTQEKAELYAINVEYTQSNINPTT